MSVKKMTVNQLRGDLEALARMWPGGIPPEQQDRVNALKGELKRRGEPEVAPPKNEPGVPASNKDPIDMSPAELEAELRSLSSRLSKDPNNEELQNRFADVRYAIRKNGGKQPAPEAQVEATPPARSPLPPRELEIPEGDPPNPISEEPIASLDQLAAKRLEKLARVKWVADLAADGGILIRHNGEALQVASLIDVAEAEEFYKGLGQVIAKAKARS